MSQANGSHVGTDRGLDFAVFTRSGKDVSVFILQEIDHYLTCDFSTHEFATPLATP